MQLCLEETELARQEAAEQVREEVEAEEVLAGWEVTYPGLVPVGIVSALIAEPDYPIKQGHPAIT